MGPYVKTISEFKSQVQSVIQNLKKLEDMRSNCLNSTQEKSIEHLIFETKSHLSKLEATNFTKLNNIIEKRRRKRRNAKIRLKRFKQQNKLTEEISTNILKNNSDLKSKNIDQTQNTCSSTGTVNQKSHQQLRSYRDSNRFLRTFELLELLHKTRVHDDELTREFSDKLSKLRSTWNAIRMENMPEKTNDIRNQWDEVLFGTPEKCYYKQEKTWNDLVCLRRKWDSFITHDSKAGSSVPSGWVLPPERPENSNWSCYIIQS